MKTISAAVAAVLCTVLLAGCSSSIAEQATATTLAAPAATTSAFNLRTRTLAEWEDMQDNMAKYAGWTFEVDAKSSGRTDQSAAGRAGPAKGSADRIHTPGRQAA